MRRFTHLPKTAAALSAGATLLTFGSYLLYEKAGLALLRGVTRERVGTVYRADEPGIFWISVLSNGFFGLLLVLAGLTVLLSALGPLRKR